MLKFRWLGRIFLCLLVGVVFGAILLGLGPPLPKAPKHLGLDGIHKYYYNHVWELSDMPEGEDMYEPEAMDLEALGLPEMTYSMKVRQWWWKAQSRLKAEKFKAARWVAEKKREKNSKK